ncbi:MAG: hypothetical protein KAR12_02040 [Methylococcales bacterium]|nr:hypothetical protein [Methylococcales bacterium]
MNTEINKKISQMLDDDLHYTEQESVLMQIKQDSQLNNKMNRYQAVSQFFKSDDFVMVKENFLGEINQELEQDPHYFLPQQAVKISPINRWKKTSAAIAASIAIVAVMVSQKAGLQNMEFQQNALTVAQKQPVSALPQAVSDSQHERFKAYLQAHSNDLYTHGSLSYQPYARVANYGQE